MNDKYFLKRFLFLVMDFHKEANDKSIPSSS